MVDQIWTSGGPGGVAVVGDTAVTLTGTGGAATTARKVFPTEPGKRYRMVWTSNSATGTFRVGKSAVRWQRPTLVNPTTVDLNTAGTKTVWTFGDTEDVIILPKSTPWTADRLQTIGGRNIVLIGGKFAPTTYSSMVGTLNFTKNRGTVYIEGVHIDHASLPSPGYKDGIGYYRAGDIPRNSEGDFIMQNCRVENVKGQHSGPAHGDCFQPQGSIAHFRAYNCTTTTTYCAFQLEPRNDHVDVDGNPDPYYIDTITMERIEAIKLTGVDARTWVYYFTESSTPTIPITFKEVYVTESPGLPAESNFVYPPKGAPQGAVRTGDTIAWPEKPYFGHITVGTRGFVSAAQCGIGYNRVNSEPVIGGEGISFVEGANSFEFDAISDKTYLEFWRSGAGSVALTGVAIQEITGGGSGRVLPVDSVTVGSEDPNAANPAALVLQALYGWTTPLAEGEALVISTNLGASAPSGDPAPPVVSVPTSLSIREGAVVQIPVAKSGAGAATVQIRTVAQTATVNVDYTAFNQTVTIPSGVTTLTVPLTALSDSATDPDERLLIELSQPSGCTLGNALCVVTITEAPRIFVPTTVSVAEGGVASVIVSKIGAGACSVTWRTRALTAGQSDYNAVTATTLTFAAADAQKTITVQTVADAQGEGSESFEVVLESPADCTITGPVCAVTILDAGSAEVPVQTALAPAVGFASAANGGLGLPVHRVTTLADSGAGSLRQGASAGNCLIVFEVAGRIVLLTDIVVGPNVTIAGETAPAPGICVQRKELLVQQSNVRISHLTFERGYEASTLASATAIKLGTGSATVPPSGPVTVSNIHFTHCAFFWGVNGLAELWPSASRRLEDVSFHSCLFAEALHLPKTYDASLSNHPRVKPGGGMDNHNFGVTVGHNTRRVDFQHCLWQDVATRCPHIDHGTDVVLGNNLANNARTGATIHHSPSPPAASFAITCKGYLVISGPDTGAGLYRGFHWHGYANPQPANSRVHTAGLYGWKGGTASSPYQTPPGGIGHTGEKPYWLDGAIRVPCDVASPPIDTPTPIVALSDQQIYDRALLDLGPRPKEIRDPALPGNKDVRRVIDRLRAKTGRWVNHEIEVGGFYAPTPVSRALNGATTFADGAAIPAVPAQPQPATEASRAAMRAWLRLHLARLQSD